MSWWRDYAVLCKARIQVMALAVAGCAAWLAAVQNDAPFAWGLLPHLAGGFALVCCAAAALNQVLEADLDARMERTRQRPLPAGRIRRGEALAFSLACAAVGSTWLAWFVNPLCAGLSLTMLATYDFVYTPLKRITPLTTVVGAFPGAMPVLVGWSAAGYGLDFVAGMLFAILFLWQIPHFIAIAWIYREDYRRAGLAMITLADAEGRASGRQAVSWALALVPASLLPSFAGGAGPLYFLGALLLSLLFLGAALRFSLGSSLPRARVLLRASLAYVPLLLLLLVADTAAAR